MQLLNYSDTWFSFMICELKGLVLQEMFNIWFSFESYNIGLFDKTNIFCVSIVTQSSER